MRLDPTDKLNSVDYAMALCEMGDDALDEAESLMKSVLAKDAHFVSGGYRLARILEAKGALTESAALYESLLQRAPEKAKVNMGYAHLLHGMGEHLQSERQFAAAERIDRGNPWFQFWRALLLTDEFWTEHSETEEALQKRHRDGRR